MYLFAHFYVPVWIRGWRGSWKSQQICRSAHFVMGIICILSRLVKPVAHVAVDTKEYSSYWCTNFVFLTSTVDCGRCTVLKRTLYTCAQQWYDPLSKPCYILLLRRNVLLCEIVVWSDNLQYQWATQVISYVVDVCKCCIWLTQIRANAWLRGFFKRTHTMVGNP